MTSPVISSRLKYGLAVVGWLLLFLAATEVFTRAFFVVAQPLSAIKKGGTFELWGVEGYGVTRYLPYGEARTPYDSGDVSVVVLGNSYTLANQVMDWQSFSSVAEERLNADGFRVNVHNLGFNGLTLPSYIARSKFILEQYQPDVIVIQVSPGDFLSNGFAPAMRGGHFEYAADGTVTLAPPASSSSLFLFPEQLTANTPPENVLNNISIFAYLSYVKKANAQGGGGEGEQEAAPAARNPRNDAETVRQELLLLDEAFGGRPVVFIFVPGDINIRKRNPFYKESERLKVIFDIIAQAQPDWKVMFPVQEFNQLLKSGYSPRGFNNTDPFVGHLNARGHRIIGEALAGALESLLRP